MNERIKPESVRIAQAQGDKATLSHLGRIGALKLQGRREEQKLDDEHYKQRINEAQQNKKEALLTEAHERQIASNEHILTPDGEPVEDWPDRD